VPIEVTRVDLNKSRVTGSTARLKRLRYCLSEARERGFGGKPLAGGWFDLHAPGGGAATAGVPSCELLRRDPNQIVAKGAALIGYKYQIDEEIERLMTPGISRDQAVEKVASATG